MSHRMPGQGTCCACLVPTGQTRKIEMYQSPRRSGSNGLSATGRACSACACARARHATLCAHQRTTHPPAPTHLHTHARAPARAHLHTPTHPPRSHACTHEPNIAPPSRAATHYFPKATQTDQQQNSQLGEEGTGVGGRGVRRDRGGWVVVVVVVGGYNGRKNVCTRGGRKG